MARRDSKAFSKRPAFVAGIFIADDFVISSAAPAHSGSLLFEQMYEPKKTRAPKQLRSSLEAALTDVKSSLPVDGWIKSFVLAMPGPLLGIGNNVNAQRRVETASFHRKGQNWSGIDISRELDLAIESAGCESVFPSNAALGFLTDAAAYAIGDYCYTRMAAPSVPSSPSEASQRDPFWEDTVFAHLIVDDGVGGAVVYRTNLLPSRLHSEIGHLPLRPHIEDSLDGACDAHAYGGCAESYLSLSSLRRRWGDNVENDLRSWPDSDPRLKLVAYYLAQLCASMVLAVAPSHISLSGRVTENQELIDLTSYGLKRLLRSPRTGRVYPGYRDQIVSGFLRRCSHVDVGIFGCLEYASRRRLNDEPLLFPSRTRK